MIPYSKIEKGIRILIDKNPYEIVEASSMFKGRGHSVLQAKMKNLITGEILSKTFHPSDIFEEAEISRINCKFLYSHRDKYFFSESSDSKKRFEMDESKIKEIAKLLKPNMEVEGVVFNDKIVNINLPIKIKIKVQSAPPGIRGDRAQGGTKAVVLETGKEINVPLFIEEGDIIEINTETKEYVRRVEKG
ncbi:MAG: elongation factor P [Candidatus Pacebacteria bacterium]|jgi:elongation factor P|nr:elongation factor P [Candidatus Paceibacterota bacterium]MDD3072226.1 elongation factor P [Candidatus Paceibacterota bacterium]MDD3729053.1 elongation factor P [Candidatus Paceibacterota bacterium]MDD4201183.1 elongation factor P [Candidatus Paceibacterota bacterium]MDD4467299.1 elongation factor P [Candidatus Paceibacterota bacterium]